MLWGQDAYWFPKCRTLWCWAAWEVMPWDYRSRSGPLHGPWQRTLCPPLPAAAARAEVPALPYQMLAFWWSVHHFPECQAFPHHSTLPNTISSPRLKTVFLGMGLNRSKYKRAGYTLLARKWLILSPTYIAEVNQWNVLHRLRKICFICSSANN